MVQKNSQLMSSDDLYIRIKLRINIWEIKNERDFCNVIYSDILSFEAVFFSQDLLLECFSQHWKS